MAALVAVRSDMDKEMDSAPPKTPKTHRPNFHLLLLIEVLRMLNRLQCI